MPADSGQRGKRLLVEGLVIVVSILLAFAIDAAWDEYQERQFRDDLVDGMRAEFIANRERLETATAEATRMRDAYAGLRAAAWEPGSVPMDSMRRLARRALVTVEFQPQRSAYHSAIAAGGARLIQRPELWGALSRFDQAYEYYADHNRLYREIYFLGPLHDVRGRLGSMRALSHQPDSLPASLVLDGTDYLDFISRPDVLGAVEAAFYAMIAAHEGLDDMAAQADSALVALDH